MKIKLMLVLATFLASCAPEGKQIISGIGEGVVDVGSPVLEVRSDTLANQVKKKVPVSKAVKMILESFSFNPELIRAFITYADSTGGKAYMAAGGSQLHNALIDVVDNQLENGIDLVFLIDNTGSMGEEIESVKKTTSSILNRLKGFKEVRVAIVTYADKNVDNPWFTLSDFKYNIKDALKSLQDITLSGGGDLPESVNDAIVKCVDSLSWRDKSKKAIVVLGDAPSLIDPLSDYSNLEVVSRCREKEIKVNLYPVILALENIRPETHEDRIKPKESIFVENLYPNPAANSTTLKFKKEGKYLVNLLSSSGILIRNWEFSGSEMLISLEDILPGIYFVSITDINADGQSEAKKLIVKK